MLIKFGGGIVDARGSVAGNTYSRNRSGAYVRARTKPINPNTARQQLVRQALSLLTTRWSQTLTAVQRAAWNLYAASVVMTNKLGENINLTGFNHYIRSNSVRSRASIPVIDDGPTIFELPETDGALNVTGSEATQILSVTFNTGLPWSTEDDAHLLIFQGTPQNAQRNFFGGPWRYGIREPGLDPGGATSPATGPALFAIAEGQRQWIYARITRADGRLSQPFRADAFIAS